MKRYVCVLFAAVFFVLFSGILSAYDIMIFGDMHYDSEAVRDENSVEKLPEVQKKELRRNLACWKNVMPVFLENAGKKTKADLQTGKGSIAFAVQLGDLIQGDCGSQELHKKSAEDALSMVKNHISARLYIVRGNHDTRGRGGQVWLNVVHKYLQDVLGLKLKKETVCFSMMYENDLYIFFDCINPDIGFVRRALAEHPDARHVFFLSHFPLVPCSPYDINWIIYGRPNNVEKRHELLKMLAERNAIVLCGHTHKPALFEYEFPEGKITQLTTFSLPLKLEQNYKRKTVFPF